MDDPEVYGMFQKLEGVYHKHLQNTTRLLQTTDCNKLPHRREMWLIELDLMHYKLVSRKRVKPGSLERGAQHLCTTSIEMSCSLRLGGGKVCA